MSHHRNSFLGTGIVLLVLLAGFSSSALATNMYGTHGYDYEFNGETLFPVAWDLRRAWFEYRDFADAYNLPVTSPEDFADARTSGILEDALDAGINTVIIRSEGSMDAENSDSRTDAPTHYLEDRADLIRSLGLNVMLGGFGDILDDRAHNEDVRDFIEDYISGMSFPEDWGNVIGIHGFDEPDGKFDNSPTLQGAIEDSLEKYHEWSNDLGVSYPFGCFMAKPAMYVPTLLDPNTGGLGLNNTIEDLCDKQDFPMLDWYPCRTWGGTNSGISITSADIWGATDLLPTSNASNFYDAYCTRDEVWTIDRDASASPAVTTFKVYEVTDEGQMGGVDLDFFCDEEVDVVWPFETASSDYRASDIGDRSGGYHDLNGAVVMYRQDDDVDEAQVVFHNGTDLILTNMPNTQVTEDTHFYCVGEQDYRVSSQFADREGILGTAGLRILWCGEGTNHGNPVTRVRIFEKVGSNIVQEGSLELIYRPSTFEPVGAVWGYFWTDSWPLRRSGFVLYDEGGHYVVVHQDRTSGLWEAVGTQLGTPFTGLFNGKTNPSVLFAYRQTTWPADHFSPARDLLLSVVDEPMIEGFLLQWRAGTGSGWSLDHPSHMHFDAEVGSADIEQASFTRVWDGNKTRFYFNGSNMNGVYNVVPFDPGWEDVMNDSSAGDIGDNASPWGLMNMPMRARHTRTPWVNTLLYNRDADQGAPSTVSIRSSIIIDDNEGSGINLASTDLYFNNLCSMGAGYQASGHVSTNSGAFDLEFEYGIPETENGGDCLFANVQAFGRYQQENATFMPSHNTGESESDTLLYMTVAPIVHGCRGISFYALDMALLCGSPGQSYMPDRLLNWAPSRDTDSNGDQDMIERVNDVVRMLTGGNGGPDFLEALIDPEAWSVLEENNAVNAYDDPNLGLVAVTPMNNLNFIALRNNSTLDILLIVSNDWNCEPYSSGGPLIWFPNYSADTYGQAECWGGYGYQPDVQASRTPDQIAESRVFVTEHAVDSIRMDAFSLTAGTLESQRSEIPLVFDFSYMPPHTVSLISITITAKSNEDNTTVLLEEEPTFDASRSVDGDIQLLVSGYRGNTELVIYDVTGRVVSELFDGALSGAETGFTIGAGELNKGIHFAVIIQNGEMVGVQRILMY